MLAPSVLEPRKPVLLFFALGPDFSEKFQTKRLLWALLTEKVSTGITSDASFAAGTDTLDDAAAGSTKAKSPFSIPA